MKPDDSDQPSIEQLERLVDVLSPALRSVTISLFFPCLRSFAKQCTRLEEINLEMESESTPKDWLQVVGPAYSSSLRTMRLWQCFMSAVDADHIALLARLETLDMTFVQQRDTEVRLRPIFKNCHALKHFSCAYCDFTTDFLIEDLDAFYPPLLESLTLDLSSCSSIAPLMRLFQHHAPQAQKLKFLSIFPDAACVTREAILRLTVLCPNLLTFFFPVQGDLTDDDLLALCTQPTKLRSIFVNCCNVPLPGISRNGLAHSVTSLCERFVKDNGKPCDTGYFGIMGLNDNTKRSWQIEELAAELKAVAPKRMTINL